MPSPALKHEPDKIALLGVDPGRMRHYAFARHWTRRIMPHLGDKRLNDVLTRDLKKFTSVYCGKQFRRGDLPRRFDCRDWDDRLDNRPRPRYWDYVLYRACHWLVNFNLRLATLAEPDRPWRIITGRKHSSVWDGGSTLFDLNFSAFDVPPAECFVLAYDRELRPGEYRRTGVPMSWREMDERDRAEAEALDRTGAFRKEGEATAA